VAHAWVEFHDGQSWREVDPITGHISVDARYIDASVFDLLSAMSGGRVEVLSVE
jgi:transglutaminase-like putative cysteine protease